MPSTWNGIGTTYIGARDRYPDGSFVTTEWFVVLMIPVLPIKSSRVVHLGSSSGWRRHSSQYLIREDAPNDIRHVLSTYFITIASIVSGIWLFYTIMSSYAYTSWGPIAGIIGIFAPFLIAQQLFFKAE
jgi:hypothetical protein